MTLFFWNTRKQNHSKFGTTWMITTIIECVIQDTYDYIQCRICRKWCSSQWKTRLLPVIHLNGGELRGNYTNININISKMSNRLTYIVTKSMVRHSEGISSSWQVSLRSLNETISLIVSLNCIQFCKKSNEQTVGKQSPKVNAVLTSTLIELLMSKDIKSIWLPIRSNNMCPIWNTNIYFGVRSRGSTSDCTRIG